MGDVLTMAQVAAALGLSYHRFRKVWKALTAQGFPAPIIGRRWDAAAVATWREARSRRVVVDVAPPEPADTQTSRETTARRARRQLDMIRAA